MRISDWRSDVCSSDLELAEVRVRNSGHPNQHTPALLFRKHSSSLLLSQSRQPRLPLMLLFTNDQRVNIQRLRCSRRASLLPDSRQCIGGGGLDYGTDAISSLEKRPLNSRIPSKQSART